VLDFERRILSDKAPADGDVLMVALSSPGGDLPCSDFQGGQALRQALLIQRGEFRNVFETLILLYYK
jgi:hypothetical protein